MVLQWLGAYLIMKLGGNKMTYWKYGEMVGSSSNGLPANCEEITYEEYMEVVNSFAPSEEPEPTYTLDEAAAIIASEVASNE